MISRPLSLIKPYTDHFSEDPAFVQAPVAPGKDATDEERETYKAALEEYSTQLTVAIDTGNWSALRVQGSEPTTFTMRPLPSDVFGKLADLKASGTGENEIYVLAFRAACVGVANMGGAKLTFVADPVLGQIASLDVFEAAGVGGLLGLRVCRELGGRALNRAAGLSGK